jgi:hypothetical protein
MPAHETFTAGERAAARSHERATANSGLLRISYSVFALAAAAAAVGSAKVTSALPFTG